jgi:peptidoglycan hydrolase CwlO-like protein
MLDTGTIGLIVSGIVAALQVFTFFDNRAVRKEQSLNTFAKADLVKTDLDTIRSSIDTKINHLFDLVETQNNELNNIKSNINSNSTDIAVIKERLDNDKEFIKKLDEKLDKILDKI